MNRLNLSFQWIFAHAMPLLLVLALFAAIGKAMGDTLLMSALSYSVLLVWVVTLQWLVMRLQGYKTGTWILATVAGIIASVFVGMIVLASLDGANILPEDMEVIPGIALAGTILGGAQWLALRRQARRAGWWILASGAGFLSGGIVYGLAKNQVSLMNDYGFGFPGHYELAMFVAAFAGYGAMTGLVMGGLLRAPASTTNIESHL